MNILGIESSCDDTSASVLTDEGVKSNIIASQTIHVKFGGVVPELASRAHQQTISYTVEQALEEADISLENIDLVAVTQGPGLMGSLLVGVCFAKGISLSKNIPMVGVNHMHAHIYANFIDQSPQFPFVCLTVSGGHTQLVLVKVAFEHEILGETRDDAAGEAFDKIGKILGLDYPAGPQMDRLSKKGNPRFHSFPQALLNKGLDFSFSGLKTSALYLMQDKSEEWKREHIHHISASISEAITEILIKKLTTAVKQTGVNSIAIAGGVSANSMLRAKAEKIAINMNLNLHIPHPTYCTDNAAMIAITGKMKYESGKIDDLSMRPFASL